MTSSPRPVPLDAPSPPMPTRENNLNSTPSANRCHIGFFGKRNSGKSSLINAFAGQSVAIVSHLPGTTTDPVSKVMEIHGLGPCVLIDTAGFDDEGELGTLRVQQTRKAAEKVDIAVILIKDLDISHESTWLDYFRSRSVPCLIILSQADNANDSLSRGEALEELIGTRPLPVSVKRPETLEAFKEALIALRTETNSPDLIGDLAQAGQCVLLVMPQDIQAPEGRLILPQVQTIRGLLDKQCLTFCCTANNMQQALAALKSPPALIITDSQVFAKAYELKPSASRLTSFSVLFAAYKGDLPYYLEGAAVIDQLTEDSHVLIAECCSHAPLSEDIGRVKLPRLLRQRIGKKLSIDIVSGSDYPDDLTSYDLIIQCGACMFSRRHVLNRIARARRQNVPMSNYGVVLAHLTGILQKITVK